MSGIGKKTIEYFQSKGITLLSWRGLGKGVLFDDPRIMTIAQELDITPSQVIVDDDDECMVLIGYWTMVDTTSYSAYT